MQPGGWGADRSECRISSSQEGLAVWKGTVEELRGQHGEQHPQ